MELNPIASWALVIMVLVFALVTAGALAGLAVALNKLNSRMEDLTAKVDPLLSKADQILTVTNEKIVSIGDKTEHILSQGEETAESVHEKVDKTATVVQRTVSAPIIGLNSLAAGVSQGFRTFGRLQQRHPNRTLAAPSAAVAVQDPRPSVMETRSSAPEAGTATTTASTTTTTTSSSISNPTPHDNGRAVAQEPIAVPVGKGNSNGGQ